MFVRDPVSDSGGVLDFILSTGEMDDKTEEVAQFYEDEPFPNYDEITSRHAMQQIAEQGLYSRAISDAIGPGGRCLEVGCGTGQLTNYLGLFPNRQVIGMDLSRASLDMAIEFKLQSSVKNTKFIRADLFNHPFESGVFDVVVANGVLHHMRDTWEGLSCITDLLKPGGLAVIGLYNTYGRWRTNLLRKVSRILGRKLLAQIDPMKFRKTEEDTLRSWVNDQYFHPLERSHSYDEALREGSKLGLQALRFLPDCTNYFPPVVPFSISESRPLGTSIDRLGTQLIQAMIDNGDGGLFVVIFRKEFGVE